MFGFGYVGNIFPAGHWSQPMNTPKETAFSVQKVNGFSVDVEDYFQVNAFSGKIKFSDWSRYEARVEKNTNKILEILEKANIRATFFVLGWIAEQNKNLIRKIAERGHEVASHGYRHELITRQTPGQFRADLERSKKILEDVTGRNVIGYRAPSYSITRRTLWALDILIEEGYKYDSSIFPVHHDVYGLPDAPRFPFIVRINRSSGREWLDFFDSHGNFGDSIVEFPMSTLRLGGLNLPVSGGGYFRLLPYWLVKRCLKYINEYERRPFLVYLHPWEFDPEQPKVKGVSLKSKFRHYLNLDKVESRCCKLINEFKFAPFRDLLASSQETSSVTFKIGQEFLLSPYFRL